jgi:hypothetical protein
MPTRTQLLTLLHPCDGPYSLVLTDTYDRVKSKTILAQLSKLQTSVFRGPDSQTVGSCHNCKTRTRTKRTYHKRRVLATMPRIRLFEL